MFWFMRIPETVSLVLQAATLDQWGAVYVREMGELIKVLEMARNLIRLSGFVLEEEISRACIGVRSCDPSRCLYTNQPAADGPWGRSLASPTGENRIACTRPSMS